MPILTTKFVSVLQASFPKIDINHIIEACLDLVINTKGLDMLKIVHTDDFNSSSTETLIHNHIHTDQVNEKKRMHIDSIRRWNESFPDSMKQNTTSSYDPPNIETFEDEDVFPLRVPNKEISTEYTAKNKLLPKFSELNEISSDTNPVSIKSRLYSLAKCKDSEDNAESNCVLASSDGKFSNKESKKKYSLSNEEKQTTKPMGTIFPEESSTRNNDEFILSQNSKPNFKDTSDSKPKTPLLPLPPDPQHLSLYISQHLNPQLNFDGASNNTQARSKASHPSPPLLPLPTNPKDSLVYKNLSSGFSTNFEESNTMPSTSNISHCFSPLLPTPSNFKDSSSEFSWPSNESSDFNATPTFIAEPNIASSRFKKRCRSPLLPLPSISIQDSSTKSIQSSYNYTSLDNSVNTSTDEGAEKSSSETSHHFTSQLLPPPPLPPFSLFLPPDFTPFNSDPSKSSMNATEKELGDDDNLIEFHDHEQLSKGNVSVLQNSQDAVSTESHTSNTNKKELYFNSTKKQICIVSKCRNNFSVCLKLEVEQLRNSCQALISRTLKVNRTVEDVDRLLKILKRLPENIDEVLPLFSSVQEHQHLSVVREIYMKTFNAFNNVDRYDLMESSLKNLPSEFWSSPTVWKDFLIIIIRISHLDLLAVTVDILCKFKKHITNKKVVEFFLLYLVGTDDAVYHLKRVLHALRPEEYEHCLTKVFKELFLKAVESENHLNVCNQLLKFCPSIMKHMIMIDKDILMQVEKHFLELNFEISAGLLDVFFRSCQFFDSREFKEAVLNRRKTQFSKKIGCSRRPWCCPNCLFTTVFFSLQNDHEKAITIQKHVTDGNYICVLNLLEIKDFDVQVLIDGCVCGIIEEDSPCNIIFDSFLSHYQPDIRMEKTFFEGLSWSLFLTLKQTDQIEEACLVAHTIIHREINFEFSKGYTGNKSLIIAKVLLQQNKLLDVWGVLNINNYAKPSCELPTNLYQLQQKEHLLFLYECIVKFFEGRDFKYSFLLLANVMKMYKNKSLLYELFGLGLMHSEIEYFSYLALTLYRLYYELFQEDNLLPIEINSFTERSIISCAVNSNQWIIAEHLFTSGQLKGYLPMQNVSRGLLRVQLKPFHILIHSYMTKAEILLTFLQFFKELKTLVHDRIVQNPGSVKNVFDIFTLTICVEELHLPDHGPGDINSSSICSYSILDAKSRIHEVCQQSLKPPLSVYEYDKYDGKFLKIYGEDFYAYITNQQLPIMNEKVIDLTRTKSGITPPVDHWLISDYSS
ncbi:hypothetical protein GQR58_015024 [Nymphon striatum]|nr:hypothetical protein GQR58_015024 [Nymphon striatum]